MKLKIYLTLILFIIAMSAESQEKSEELKKIEEQAAIAKAKKELAESELAIARSSLDLANLTIADKKLNAEAEKSLVELNKAIADAKASSIQANRDLFKGPAITAPTGAISSNDGVFIESRVMANRTLSQAMVKFVNSFDTFQKAKYPVKDEKLATGVTFLLHNAADIQNLELYVSIHSQVNSMLEEYKKISNRIMPELQKNLDPGVGVPSSMGDPLLLGYAAAGALRTVADIVSLFRTTSDYKNFDLTSDDNLITASLKSAMLKTEKPWRIYNPSVFPVNTIKDPATAQSTFMAQVNLLHQKNVLALSDLEKVEARLREWEPKLPEEKDPIKKERIRSYLEKFEGFKSLLKALTLSYAQFQANLSTADVQTKTTPIALIMRAERLSIKLNEAGVYTLKVLATSKGSNKVTQNLWRSARISFTAGTELSMVAYAPDGEIIYAESFYEYSDYKTPGEISSSSGN